MNNRSNSSITVAGQPAVITYVPEINLFRGRFTGLSGYCDFVSDSVQGLHKEGEISLREYLEDCAAFGINLMLSRKKLRPSRCDILNRWESVSLRLLRKMKLR